MMAERSKILLLLLFMLWIPFGLEAASGKISGRVYDRQNGEALVAANVMITQKWDNESAIDLERKIGAFTDNDGYFIILNVEPGYYTLKVTMIGYSDYRLEQVRVNMDRTIQVEFPMIQKAVSLEAVTVVAEKEIIKPDLASSQEIIVRERLQDAPALRMDEFISSMKGIDLISDNDGAGLSIRGGSVSETDIQLDGISARDARSGNSYLSINSSSVEELQVLTGGFEAKYGGIQSGLVNVITKEGSREKYSFSARVNYTPAGQQRFFGENPWGEEGIIFRIFGDTTENGFAFTGAAADTAGIIPTEFSGFRGWNNNSEGRRNYESVGLTIRNLPAALKHELWLIQHPTYEVAQRPDIYLEGTLTGPVPLTKTATFMLAGKLERSEFAYPIGPRDYYLDWNTHLKITLRPSENSKLSLSGMYAHMSTNTTSRPSTVGGGLQDYSSRFGYLSNSEQAVRQQASILQNYNQMYNKSFLQYLDQYWFMGGIKWNQTLSPRSYFTLEAQVNYQDNNIMPMAADPTLESSLVWLDTLYQVLNYPVIGTPNGSTNYGKDLTDLFYIFGGLQAVDSSYTVSTSVKGNYAAQLGRNHLLEAGFNFNYTHSFVYAGTWYQSSQMYTTGVPDTWQYYTARPIEGGIYIQDKLEFRGLIATIGLRGDYFNPQKDKFILEHPINQAYPDFYNLVYQYLPGAWGSYERWVVFRDMLESPPNWPTEAYHGEFKVSPRLGVSFPITVNSKMYFNYGHFYQRPNYNYLYNMAIVGDKAIIPTPELPMAKTVSYEFGYEQSFLNNFLANVVVYYKDMSNIPLPRTWINYWEEFSATKYAPDGYSDTRGVELRLEKSAGRFFTFWCNLDYMLKSWGQSGMRYQYENRVTAANEARSANLSTLTPLPTANISAAFHTPANYGLPLGGIYPLGGWRISTQFRWADGGEIVIRTDPLTGEQLKAKIVDYSNTDLRAVKRFALAEHYLELGVTITNLFNQKRLYTGGMSSTQYNNYKNSLKFPFEDGDEHGNDKWGEWNKDYIDTGWLEAPVFLTPRRIVVSLTLDI
ncbi:MAG: TonB-dependent receptor [Candidatus Marinimicrobia bacterium]|nr:TonB-dependent receptor [Candidatus Neomarinimicrobiota bacterium]